MLEHLTSTLSVLDPILVVPMFILAGLTVATGWGRRDREGVLLGLGMAVAAVAMALAFLFGPSFVGWLVKALSDLKWLESNQDESPAPAPEPAPESPAPPAPVPWEWVYAIGGLAIAMTIAGIIVYYFGGKAKSRLEERRAALEERGKLQKKLNKK